MEIHYDIWLDNDGKAFGEECFRLLEAVEKTGSLNKAASDMNMSYAAALRTLQKSEKRLGFALLARQIGGPSGGGSHPTPMAMELMKRYRSFTNELMGTLSHICRRHFDLNRGLHTSDNI